MAFTESTHPGRTPFLREAARQRDIREAKTPEEYIAALVKSGNLSQGEQAMIQQYMADPDKFELREGTILPKKSKLLQSMHLWGPAAIIGGSALAALPWGALGGGSGGGGVLSGLKGLAGKVGGTIAGGLGGIDLQGLGRTLSGAAAGSAEQRLAEDESARQAALFAQGSQDRARRNAVLSSLIGNIQDVEMGGFGPKLASRIPSFTGGLRPSAITGGGQREALLSLLANQQANAPVFTPSQGGLGENILGGAGLVTGALGSLFGSQDSTKPSELRKAPPKGAA